MEATGALCRDCLHPALAGPPRARRCARCGSPPVIEHPELDQLVIAHIDCDAFYAAIEKRDHPELAEQPVIVGGRHRGVVMSCCYLARGYGIRSATPTFKALKLCPHAVVIAPDMDKYAAAGRAVRTLMEALSPAVEPLSIDEAFIDLGGTRRLFTATPARLLARQALDVKREVGIGVSIGLSYNKSLAKLLSSQCKPDGFAAVGRADALAFLTDKPVALLWGVGPTLDGRLARDGIRTIGALRELSESALTARYGVIGRRLWRLSRGLDERSVTPERIAKGMSAETTFEDDLADPAGLGARLAALCERLSRRLRRAEFGARTVTLKLKSADFRLRTRRRTLATPTQRSGALLAALMPLVEDEAPGMRYRLIGVGASGLVPDREADPPELFESDPARRDRLERSRDLLRASFGAGVLRRARDVPPPLPRRRSPRVARA
ncbi:MAG: DNA polymerase IV [Alphaproteobacteria bacterium]|nr:DNA polymerase IV [Alphaproteobacteria bacterium]